MHVTIRVFDTPKAGNSPSDYEDAYWPRKPFDGTMTPVRLAVGDGATETSFSALWAKMLVVEYGLGHLTAESFFERLPLLQGRWRHIVGKKPLPWYAEEKLRAGAFSSLVGLTIEDDPVAQGSSGTWEALAVGDSCCFQTRGEKLIAAFPLARAEQFDSRPLLISSVRAGNRGLEGALRKEAGRWKSGDVFYLMTDALACWFLRCGEILGGDPLDHMSKLRKGPDFKRLIMERRSDPTDHGQPKLRNDDVTLVRCCINGPQ